MLRLNSLLLAALTLYAHSATATEPLGDLSPAERGYWFILNKPYVNVDLDQQTFDQIWQVWPEALREKASKASPGERRRMAFSRYGLTDRPGDQSGKPLQYVVNEGEEWVQNCFSCHGGKVAGRVIPGLPNSHYALQTLTEESRAVKRQLGKKLTPKELSSYLFPLGGTNGTTNAVMFGVALGAFRDDDLNVVADRPLPKLVHHDMDAPPWWHFSKRKRLYIDGFAQKGHRALMPFALIRENGPDKFREWESDFRDIYAYLESLEPPKYPFNIDDSLAERGRQVFDRSCADCHGTYGENESYPHRMVPIDEIGTDRVRLEGLSAEHRVNYGRGWFAHYGKQETVGQPEGYLAPPLDGIWATAPYFHNGSVPTLWHVLHPAQRPAVWQRTENGYDRHRVGLEIKQFDELPKSVTRVTVRRTYSDTRRFGKSAAGHSYPYSLSETEIRALLEYLKTL